MRSLTVATLAIVLSTLVAGRMVSSSQTRKKATTTTSSSSAASSFCQVSTPDGAVIDLTKIPTLEQNTTGYLLNGQRIDATWNIIASPCFEVVRPSSPLHYTSCPSSAGNFMSLNYANSAGSWQCAWFTNVSTGWTWDSTSDSVVGTFSGANSDTPTSGTMTIACDSSESASNELTLVDTVSVTGSHGLHYNLTMKFKSKTACKPEPARCQLVKPSSGETIMMGKIPIFNQNISTGYILNGKLMTGGVWNVIASTCSPTTRQADAQLCPGTASSNSATFFAAMDSVNADIGAIYCNWYANSANGSSWVWKKTGGNGGVPSFNNISGLFPGTYTAGWKLYANSTGTFIDVQLNCMGDRWCGYGIAPSFDSGPMLGHLVMCYGYGQLSSPICTFRKSTGYSPGNPPIYTLGEVLNFAKNGESTVTTVRLNAEKMFDGHDPTKPLRSIFAHGHYSQSHDGGVFEMHSQTPHSVSITYGKDAPPPSPSSTPQAQIQYTGSNGVNNALTYTTVNVACDADGDDSGAMTLASPPSVAGSGNTHYEVVFNFKSKLVC